MTYRYRYIGDMPVVFTQQSWLANKGDEIEWPESISHIHLELVELDAPVVVEDEPEVEEEEDDVIATPVVVRPLMTRN